MIDTHSSSGTLFSQSRIGFYLACSLAILLPFSRAATSIITGLIVIYWIYCSILTRTNVLSGKPRLFWAIVAYILFGLISLLWTHDLVRGLDDLGIYTYWILIPALAGLIKPGDVNRIFTAFLISMVISQLLFWGRDFGFWVLKHGTTPFMNHIEYGIFIVATIIVLLTRIMGQYSSRPAQFLLTSLLLISVLTLFTSTGLTGQVAFVAIVPFVILKYSCKSLNPAMVVIAASLLLIATFATSLLLSPVFFKNINEYKEIENMMAGNAKITSVGQRSSMIIVGTEVFRQNPIVGAGFGDNMHEYEKVLKSQYPSFITALDGFASTHLHTQYLEVATKTGAIGLLLFANVFYFYFKLHIEIKEIDILRTLFGVCFLAGFVGEPLWHKQFSTVLFAIFTGLFIASSQLAKPERARSSTLNPQAHP